jgi:hypothetical protein
MDASRLLDLLIDLEAEIVGGYEEALTGLSRAYTQARDTPGLDHSSAITSAAERLHEVTESSVVNGFPPSRVAMLAKLEADSLFGDAAWARIEDALAEAHSGPASVVTELEELKAELAKFREAAASIHESFEALGIEPEGALTTECEVGITIPSALTGAQLGPLAKELAKWNKILRTFAEVAGETEREVTVRALATGSYDLFVISACTTGLLVATAVERLANLYKTILEIQILRSQLTALKVPTAEPTKIKEHEKALLKEGIDDLVKELFKMTPAKLEIGRKNELKVQLTQSVTQIAAFIDSGGSVEVVPPADEEDEAEEDGDDGDDEGQEGEDAEVAELTGKELAEIRRLAKKREIERERNDKIRQGGAALAALPDRSQPILQLPPSEEAASEELH